MQIRQHKDIIAIKQANQPAIAFHANNLEAAAISEDAWESMAPTTFENSFSVSMLPGEKGVVLDAYNSLEAWLHEIGETTPQQSQQKVTSLTINITQLCNLHCTYCAAGGDGTYGDPVAKISIEKTLPQIQYFLEKLSQGENFKVTFLGGEPLLYPEAIKIIADYTQKAANKIGVKANFNIITNATLVDELALKILCDYKMNVTASIDGPPEIHDLARPQKNGQASSEKALEGLKKLIEKKHALGGLLVHSVFSKRNTDVEKVYNFLVGLNVDHFEFTFDITEADDESNQRFLFEMSKVASQAYAKNGERGLRQLSLFNSYFQTLDDQVKIENHCGTGKSLLSLDARNKIYACPLDVGQQASQVGDSSAIDTEKLLEFKQSLLDKNNCQSCWARYLCGGGCLFNHKALTGNKHKKHTSYCERTRYLIGLTLLYYVKCRA